MTSMLNHLLAALIAFCSLFKSHRQLALANLARRQQLAMLKLSVKRPRVSAADRLFWVLFSKTVDGWRAMFHALHSDTVVRWHREGFRCYWCRRSRRHGVGRPPIDAGIRKLIRDMQSANTGWGAPRIHGELLKLGLKISQAIVSKYIARHRKPPSQRWRTFIESDADCLAAIDFFIVPTATFRVLYVFIVLSQDRRQIVHFKVTTHPSAQWTAQQIVEAFPFDATPRYLLRDRDGVYGKTVQRRINSLAIEEVITAPRSPWQNPFVERVIGSMRRECLDYVIVLNERHLRRILREYFHYYNTCRTHLSLNKDPSEPRMVETSVLKDVIAFPLVGGLHHRYGRMAA